MYKLTTYTELELAHRLTHAYMGKCTAAHGHRYQVEITLASKDLNADRMVIDFKRLKEIVKEQLDDQWDHGFALYKDDPLVPAFKADAHNERFHILPENPTLEYMVKEWYHSIKRAIAMLKAEHPEGIAPNAHLVSIKASETARNTCEYSEKDEQAEKLPSPECQLKEMEKDTCSDGRSYQQKLGDLMTRTDYPEDVCLKALIDCGWDFARAERNLAYEYDHGRTPGYYRQKADAPLMELKETPKIARPEVKVQETTEEDELRDDEEAYHVSYWPVGYPQPVSGVFATAMRGIALVRTLQAAIDEKHPGGATLISFNRVPR